MSRNDVFGFVPEFAAHLDAEIHRRRPEPKPDPEPLDVWRLPVLSMATTAAVMTFAFIKFIDRAWEAVITG